MLELFRDPLWQFIGALLAIIAIIVSIVLYYRQRRWKVLSYEIVSRTSLLSVAKEVEGKLLILFEGKSVRKVHLVEISIINTGNVPIIPVDYKKRVRLKFPGDAKILSAEVSKTEPELIEVELDVHEREIILKPTLLNDGDSITIKSLVSELSDVIIEGRIVGVKRIAKRAEGISRRLVIQLIGMLMTMVGAILFSTTFIVELSSAYEIPLGMILMILGYFLMLIGNRRFRKAFENLLDKFLKFFS